MNATYFVPRFVPNLDQKMLVPAINAKLCIVFRLFCVRYDRKSVRRKFFTTGQTLSWAVPRGSQLAVDVLSQ